MAEANLPFSAARPLIWRRIPARGGLAAQRQGKSLRAGPAWRRARAWRGATWGRTACADAAGHVRAGAESPYAPPASLPSQSAHIQARRQVLWPRARAMEKKEAGAEPRDPRQPERAARRTTLATRRRRAGTVMSRARKAPPEQGRPGFWTWRADAMERIGPFRLYPWRSWPYASQCGPRHPDRRHQRSDRDYTRRPGAEKSWEGMKRRRRRTSLARARRAGRQRAGPRRAVRRWMRNPVPGRAEQQAHWPGRRWIASRRALRRPASGQARDLLRPVPCCDRAGEISLSSLPQRKRKVSEWNRGRDAHAVGGIYAPGSSFS